MGTTAMNTQLANKAIANALPLALGAGVILFAVYFVLRKAVGDTVGAVASTAGGVVSGNNALTKDTAYEGRGILGTLGAAVNAATGGAGEWAGERIASWFDHETVPGDSNIYYSVIFPDGARHAVGNAMIDKEGYFTRAGIRYRLGTSATGQRVAVRV